MSGSAAHMGENSPDHIVIVCVERLGRKLITIGEQLSHPMRKLPDRQHEVCNLSVDGIARHGGIFCLFRILDEHDSARLLDSLHPNRTVRPGTSENDRKFAPMLLGERPKEKINRRPEGMRLFEGERGYRTVGNLKLTVRRNDVYVVAFKARLVLDLCNRHARPCRQNVRKLASGVRIEMDNDDEGGARVIRYKIKEGLKSLNATRRGSDCDNRRIQFSTHAHPPGTAQERAACPAMLPLRGISATFEAGGGHHYTHPARSSYIS